MFMLFWCRFFFGNLSGLGGGPFHVKGGFIFPSRCCDGIFVGHRDRCIGDQRHIFSSCDEFACFKTEVLLIYELSSGEPYEWNCNFIVLHPKFHVEKSVRRGFLSEFHLINPRRQFMLAEDQPFYMSNKTYNQHVSERLINSSQFIEFKTSSIWGMLLT